MDRRTHERSGSGTTGVGLAFGSPRKDAGEWVLERRAGDRWTQVQRFGSRGLAQERLDEMAAVERVPLEDLRLRQTQD